MAFAAAAESNSYGPTTLAGQATAVLGNTYRDVFNIQQATIQVSSIPIGESKETARKVVRQNKVLPGGRQTLETITTYNDGNSLSQKGTSQQVEVLWQRCGRLGFGQFGEVYREDNVQGDLTKSRAVKVLRRHKLEHSGIDYKKELGALIQLSQPDYVHRFVEFYSWYESESNIYLAMEFVLHGDLASYIENGLEESEARQIACQVLDGIRIMHRLDLIHRDIKPANVLVVQTQPCWQVKIADFSICKSTITRQTILRTQVGTDGYQAPEIIGLIDSEKPNMYSSKCDIWSFGCLVFETLTGELPFPNVGSLNRYCDGKLPFPTLRIEEAGASSVLTEFIRTMLQPKPQYRPTADQSVFLLSYRHEESISSRDPNETSHLYLQDCIGRIFRIPWELCSTWSAMQSTARSALTYIAHESIGARIARGDFELRNTDQEILRPETWHAMVSPGIQIMLQVDVRQRERVLRPPTTDQDQQIPVTASLESEPLPASSEIQEIKNLSICDDSDPLSSPSSQDGIAESELDDTLDEPVSVADDPLPTSSGVITETTVVPSETTDANHDVDRVRSPQVLSQRDNSPDRNYFVPAGNTAEIKSNQSSIPAVSPSSKQKDRASTRNSSLPSKSEKPKQTKVGGVSKKSSAIKPKTLGSVLDIFRMDRSRTPVQTAKKRTSKASAWEKPISGPLSRTASRTKDTTGIAGERESKPSYREKPVDGIWTPQASSLRAVTQAARTKEMQKNVAAPRGLRPSPRPERRREQDAAQVRRPYTTRQSSSESSLSEPCRHRSETRAMRYPSPRPTTRRQESPDPLAHEHLHAAKEERQPVSRGSARSQERSPERPLRRYLSDPQEPRPSLHQRPSRSPERRVNRQVSPSQPARRPSVTESRPSMPKSASASQLPGSSRQPTVESPPASSPERRTQRQTSPTRQAGRGRSRSRERFREWSPERRSRPFQYMSPPSHRIHHHHHHQRRPSVY